MTTTAAAAPIALKSLEDVTAHTKEAVETFLKVGQEAATRNYGQALTVAKEQAEKTSQQLLKGYDDLASFSKDNAEAALASGTIVAKGLETVGKSVYAYAQSSLEAGVSVGKQALTVKTFRELVDLQSSYAKRSFETLVAESTKISELSLKIANEALEPIQARVTATVQKFGKAA
jgi:phasin family protein